MIVRGGILSILILLAFAASACGGDGATPADAGGGDAARDAWSGCSSPIECDDGLFCNGAERCMPGASGAGADGCLAAESSPCLPSQRCDESSARCLSDCELDPDADGDGVSSLDCGGSDCDDADAERYPGATEICDAEGHDEDCDPTTLGPDVDGDGFVGAACCFLELPGGSLRCGADCDDGSRDIRPTAPESCNGLDDDCDGFTDEEV
ncbi:MAG: putative metal-binding motif-containing protein, partial [Myxococcales bacterium]|nr:putative metal-binding motif-containing protein [Myxococcales bacterium]